MDSNSDIHDAQLVIDTLQALADELRAISDASEDSKHQPETYRNLSERLRRTKTTLNQLAKTGTTDGKKRPLTAIEEDFFWPAVQAASANFRMVVTAPASKWHDGLADPIIDIEHAIHGLQSAFMPKE